MTVSTTCQLPLPTARWLTAAQAAAYVGVDAEEFRQEVDEGLWPDAVRSSASRGDLWDRIALDRASDQLSGIGDSACGGTGSPTPALLTAEQAARVAGCSVNTITRSTHKELPRRGRGQRALFNHDDVVVFAAKERRRTPEPQPCQIDDLLARYRK
jgi:hypothetical protein